MHRHLFLHTACNHHRPTLSAGTNVYLSFLLLVLTHCLGRLESRAQRQVVASIAAESRATMNETLVLSPETQRRHLMAEREEERRRMEQRAKDERGLALAKERYQALRNKSQSVSRVQTKGFSGDMMKFGVMCIVLCRAALQTHSDFRALAVRCNRL
jgi:hypothetical protein